MLKPPDKPVIVITGTRKGIGKYLAQYYLERGFIVAGCSREPAEQESDRYRHFCLDVCDEPKVKRMFGELRKAFGRLDALINNARSEEHTSELQSRQYLVCRLLLEKKKKKDRISTRSCKCTRTSSKTARV